MYKYIPIQKELIPYSFDIVLDNKTYTFEVKYNVIGDFFTVDLMRDSKIIIVGEKIVYGRALFLNARHLGVPNLPIIPYDLALNTDRITYDNLNETVFLWLMEGDNTDDILGT